MPGESTLPACGAGHVRVLALGVDDVGGDAASYAAKHAELGGEALAAARPGKDGGVGVEVRAVPGVVDHRRAGPHVDAVEGAAAGVQVRWREGEEAGQGRGVEAAPVGDGVQGQGQRRKQALALAEGQGVQLAEGRAEVGLRPLGHLLERGLVPAVKGHGEGCVEEPLPASLHLVAQAGHVLQGDLRLGRHGAAPLEGEGLGRLEADLLPLQGPGRLLRRYRADVDGQVHRRARRHQPLEESGGQGPGPLAQVEGACHMRADADVAPAYLHLDGLLLVELGGRAAQGGGDQQHLELSPPQRVDGQPGPGEQAPQVVDAGELAHGVEAPVEDAVPRLQVGEQAPEGLRRRPRLRGKVGGLGLTEVFSQASQAGRVLPDEQLGREVQGVERPGEGAELGLVDLQPHHLADAELDPVEAHRPVVVQVGQHEEQGRVRRRLGRGLLRFAGVRGGPVRAFRLRPQGREPEPEVLCAAPGTFYYFSHMRSSPPL